MMGTCPLSYVLITTKGGDRQIYTCALMLPYVPLSTTYMLEFDKAQSAIKVSLRHKQKRVTVVAYSVIGHMARREKISASHLGRNILRLSPPIRTT
ncbi:hypothetical protein TRIATDRAFT_300446 [Trichoderma atroviride IMI 206040]|uniref:Uncharacterized protein n=1 Tax=Hypocrea atroviridis (strain ATCC 20476 / IMI 206040) TaxID=452589 RepID=G9P087_HYPAI|nr:uncharacterized protein TRIATDRAFT_300446 [Trichoderma atroviride IMI 206040]EHK44131.1 hypothetical protein TRIATDRAFT_300446 [Trichoderma atroviride IMI 206040]